MQLLTLGLNHTTAPLSLREKVAFPGDALRDALADLRRHLRTLIPETAILSTCNRTELYCAVHEPERAQHALTQFIAAEKRLDVAFDDGRSFSYPAELLRVESPSAEVQGHSTPA